MSGPSTILKMQTAGGFACFGKSDCKPTPSSASARASIRTTLQSAKTVREEARTLRADQWKALREQKKAARADLLQELAAQVQLVYKDRLAKELTILRQTDPNMDDSERRKVAMMLAEEVAYRMKVVGADAIILKVDEMFPRAGGKPRARGSVAKQPTSSTTKKKLASAKKKRITK